MVCQNEVLPRSGLCDVVMSEIQQLQEDPTVA